ncbi:MAG: TonB-dependent receptor [Gemmatimonadaceae bacterium]|nr:TonB-dependent receptor [Gemmatimonadaceae bacterium]
MSSTRARLAARRLLVHAGAILMLAPAIHAQQRDTTTRDSTRVRTLPPVRVVATPARQADAASAVTILPTAIRTTPATNAWDIVRQTAGVEVHQQGQGPGFASDAVIRGFTSDHSTDVAITVDGVPLNQPVNGHAEGYADWNEILPEAVSRIRVLKGPVSPWIGNFAMGGEVEVETVPLAVGTRVSARSGSYGDGRVTLVTGTAGEHGGFVLAGGAQREDGWRPNSRSSTEHLLYSRSWTSGETHTTTFGASGYAAQWDSPGFLTLDQFAHGDVARAADRTDGGSTATGLVRGSIDRAVGHGVLHSLLYGRAGMWHIFLNIPPEGGIGEGAPSQTEELDRRLDAGGTTRYARQLGSVHLMAGVDYRAVRASYQRYFTTRRVRDSVFSFDNGAPARLDATYVSAAPIVEAHWEPTARLSIGLGGRIDWMRYGSSPRGLGSTHDSHVVASPKVSALYHLTPALSAYAAFNGGFRAADGSIAEPSLAPSRAWASEAGVRASADHVEGSVALFDVEVTNEQTFNPVTQETIANGRSRRRGVELDGRVGITPAVALFAHATINDAHYLRLVNDEGESLAGTPVFGVARATVESGVDLQYRGALGSIWAAYTGPFTPIAEPEARTSPYTLVNMRGTIPLTGAWSLALGVQNILDRSYPEVRASGFVSPGQPRTVLLTVLWGGAP